MAAGVVNYLKCSRFICFQIFLLDRSAYTQAHYSQVGRQVQTHRKNLYSALLCGVRLSDSNKIIAIYLNDEKWEHYAATDTMIL